ncbi:unnamed protein product [Cutaneotrichosporon oleaginosum]
MTFKSDISSPPPSAPPRSVGPKAQERYTDQGRAHPTPPPSSHIIGDVRLAVYHHKLSSSSIPRGPLRPRPIPPQDRSVRLVVHHALWISDL